MEMREKPLSLSLFCSNEGGIQHILSAALKYTLVVARQSERESAERRKFKNAPKTCSVKVLDLLFIHATFSA